MFSPKRVSNLGRLTVQAKATGTTTTIMQFWYMPYSKVPGEFVHKEANSETAEEKTERRDHNDEGYFAYSRSHQILEKNLWYFTV